MYVGEKNLSPEVWRKTNSHRNQIINSTHQLTHTFPPGQKSNENLKECRQDHHIEIRNLCIWEIKPSFISLFRFSKIYYSYIHYFWLNRLRAASVLWLGVYKIRYCYRLWQCSRQTLRGQLSTALLFRLINDSKLIFNSTIWKASFVNIIIS